MWLWYNTQLIRDKELILSTKNRAFQYGDGIFETIIVKDGQVQHAEYHEKRMSLGLKTLKLHLDLSFEEIRKRIGFLIKKNKFTDARAKVIIWRTEGGYYVPESNGSEYLITVAERTAFNANPQKVDVSKEVRIPKSITANCKTLNALHYILAGIELKKRGDVDDLILLDYEGNISECISSNIFWKKGEDYFTPSLETSCVAGVKRAYIIDHLKGQGIPIYEIKAKPDDLLKADAVFKTNVTGIVPVGVIGNKNYSSLETLWNDWISA